MIIISRFIRYLVPVVVFAMFTQGRAAPDPDPARFEQAIMDFEAADRKNPPPEKAILFIGSSSIRMWKTLVDDFPEHQVIRRGFGGSHLSDVIAYSDRILLPYRPRQVLVYAGDNDIAAGKSPNQVLADFKELTRVIHRQLPDTRVGFIAIKPSIARLKWIEPMRQANALVETYAKEDNRLEYIDIFTPMLDEDGRPREELFIEDNLHLNAKGYRLWQRIVRPYLDRPPAGEESSP